MYVALPADVDALNLFGLAAAAAMPVFYALEDRRARYTLAVAAACLLASLYGFMHGRVVLRPRRGHLGRRGRSAMACEDTERVGRRVPSLSQSATLGRIAVIIVRRVRRAPAGRISGDTAIAPPASC